uniref:uncharacterized protein LOC122579143 n=1 Tax=Erigeron canadensis TaxID=72917 RepID=UPI001CB8CBB0|nr:uncharacterized protein LOC122579143 [Erigeron canadensis]
MKKPGFLAASMAAASAITVSNINNQTTHQDDYGASSIKHKEESMQKKTSCCSDKFAPRFDGLRFIETLVTAHR